ncbi:MAG: LysR substrate-binding domain-containing protein, partial [Betaproteobacteria bacterium]
RQLGHTLVPIDFTLLHQISRLYAWPRWLKQHDIVVPEVMPGPRFELFSMMVEVVRAGLGIALLPEIFVVEDIRRRELTQLFPAEKNTHGAYYLIYPKRKANIPGLNAFRNWLLSQANSTQKAK